MKVAPNLISLGHVKGKAAAVAADIKQRVDRRRKREYKKRKTGQEKAK